MKNLTNRSLNTHKYHQIGKKNKKENLQAFEQKNESQFTLHIKAIFFLWLAVADLSNAKSKENHKHLKTLRHSPKRKSSTTNKDQQASKIKRKRKKIHTNLKQTSHKAFQIQNKNKKKKMKSRIKTRKENNFLFSCFVFCVMKSKFVSNLGFLLFLFLCYYLELLQNS